MYMYVRVCVCVCVCMCVCMCVCLCASVYYYGQLNTVPTCIRYDTIGSISTLVLPQVYTWGCNDEGALGRETEEGEEYIPQSVEKLENVTVVQISAGDSHTVALANNGDVYCWGVFRVSMYSV